MANPLTNKGNFKIGNTEFQAKSIKVNYESLSGPNSGRTLDGVMHIDWVYNRVRKLEIQMPPMTGALAASLLAAIQGKEYNITYFDPLTNNYKISYCYTSNSNGNLYSGIIRDGLWQGITFNAIETEGELDV